MSRRSIARWILGLLYTVAGCFHLAAPAAFLSIMPRMVPWQAETVFWTGVAELLGAAALVQPWSTRLRRAGALALALYALCVFPANINHFALDMARPDGGLGLAYHLPRMIAQPLLIWLTLWSVRIVGPGRSAEAAGSTSAQER